MQSAQMDNDTTVELAEGFGSIGLRLGVSLLVFFGISHVMPQLRIDVPDLTIHD
jgi:hypothetical protein